MSKLAWIGGTLTVMFSDGTFATAEIPARIQPTITIISPNGGEVFKPNDTINITWSSNAESNYYVTYSNLDQHYIDPIITNATGTSYSWSIPSTLSPGRYQINVANGDPEGNATASDSSDSYFTIASSTTSVPIIDVQTSSVVGRYIFYNNSAFDKDNPLANIDDDGAIAPDKTVLLPGQTATFANYTSYSRGINGVMVDLTTGSHDSINANDFAFKIGNDNNPANWVTAPTPDVTIRPGAGVNGSNRVTIIWPDNAIQKQWLQITIKATTATNLLTDSVFYFGNAIGETGDSSSTTSAVVNGIDEARIRSNPRTILHLAPIDFAFDINRNTKVDLADQGIARANSTESDTALNLISIPIK
jgi:hypothetical protein